MGGDAPTDRDPPPPLYRSLWSKSASCRS